MNQSLLDRMLLDLPWPMSRARVASMRLLISSFTCLLTWYRHRSCLSMDSCSPSGCTARISASILPSCSLILAMSVFTSCFMISTISALGTLYLQPDCSFLLATALSLLVLASELASCYLACLFSSASDSLLLMLCLPLERECLEVLSTMQMQSLSFSLLAFLPSWLLSLLSFDWFLPSEGGCLWRGSDCVWMWDSSSRSMTSLSSFWDSITLISTISSAGVSAVLRVVAARSAKVLVASQSKATADLLRLYMWCAGCCRRFLFCCSSSCPLLLRELCGLLDCLECMLAVV